MPKVNLITLGCPKNTVDSERMHGLLELNGYDVTDEADEADVIVVKTDPLADIKSLENVDNIGLVVKDGRIVKNIL